jgi:ABC-type polysaccharide/polyol phosphate transport system ATPase subunit
MKARLGFSIATSITPDILLLDEVLGTGDQEFRAKSQFRIRELMTQAKAIVMVTHDLTYVTEFCNRALLLEQGRLVHDGAPDETVALYRERVTKKKLLAAGTSGRFEATNSP